ncbi:YciC family protein [Gordonia hirsuta]|nr:YciC family protein [Gordonia hirsuta]
MTTPDHPEQPEQHAQSEPPPISPDALPPAGNYPPPPYPPPGPGFAPPGGYPPPGSEYPVAPPSGRADFGQALTWSWQVFSRRPGPMVLPGLLMLASTLVGIILIVVALLWMFGDSFVYDEYGMEVASTTDFVVNAGGVVLLVLAGLLMAIATPYLQGAVLSGVLKVSDGTPVSARDFLVPVRFGAFLVTVVLTAIVVMIGFVLLVIPGLLAIFALQYAPVMVLDQKKSPIQAMTASARLAFAKPGDSVLVAILHYVFGYVGSLAFGLGAIVTLPMGEAFLVHCYRSLVSRPVPPGLT